MDSARGAIVYLKGGWCCFMPKKVEKVEQGIRDYSPARTPEARELQLISLAYDLAEKQLLDGTASSQTINHFLQLGSSRDKLEKEIMEEDKKLKHAKTEAIQSSKTQEEQYKAVLAAMKSYGGIKE